MKLKLTILILTMICVSVFIPATGQPAQAYPAPVPTGHIISDGAEGSGRAPAVILRETDQPDPTPEPYPAPVIEYRQPAALRRR